MTKYNLSEIMKDAWKRFNNSKRWVSSLTFAQCLRYAWAAAKEAIKAAAEAARTGLRRMHYSEYKNNYADCKTVDGSYDKATKTIEVMTKVSKYATRRPAAFGLCPHCHTYCYGDCRA